MTGWHRQQMGVLDTETTAPDPEVAHLVSACVGTVGPAGPDVVQTIVDPGVEIPQGAIDVHGITNERARAEGCEPGEAVYWLLQNLTWIWLNGGPVIAFNAAYDLTVVDREARRHLGYGLEITGPVVDPFVIDREIDKYRKGSRKLDAMATHYKVALNGAHDATQDALAAGRVAWRIAEWNPKIAAMSLEQLHEAQIAWHFERQEDYRKYLMGQGKPSHDVNGDWPMRQLLVGAQA